MGRVDREGVGLGVGRETSWWVEKPKAMLSTTLKLTVSSSLASSSSYSSISLSIELKDGLFAMKSNLFVLQLFISVENVG